MRLSKMFKAIIIVFSCVLWSLGLSGQRITVGAGLVRSLVNTGEQGTATQFLYFEPFVTQYGEQDGISEIGLIRVNKQAYTYGLDIGASGYLSYRSKNRFSMQFNIGSRSQREQLFYQRSNTFQQYTVGSESVVGSAPNYYFTTTSFFTDVDLQAGYLLTMNRQLHLSALAGGFFSYRYFRGYNSVLNRFNLAPVDVRRLEEIEKLLFDLTQPGNALYGVSAGLQCKWHSADLSLTYRRMLNDFIAVNANSYLQRSHQLMLRLSIDLLSISLSKFKRVALP